MYNLHLIQWRWLWRRWRWRWRWWWSSRGGTFRPSSRPHSSSTQLVAEWRTELLLLVATHPRRWFSFSSLYRQQGRSRTSNRWKQSEGLRWSRSCWQKTTWASSPPPQKAWNILVSIGKHKRKITYTVLPKKATIRMIWFILWAVWYWLNHEGTFFYIRNEQTVVEKSVITSIASNLCFLVVTYIQVFLGVD